MNSAQLLGIVGSILLFVGTFAPILSVPILGSMNYFQNGRGDGTVIAVLALISFLAVIANKYRVLWFTGLGSLVLLAYTFITFQSRYAQAKAAVDRELAGNPFRGLADLAIGAVQLQWGWAVLVVGALLVLVAAGLGNKQSEHKTTNWNARHIILVGFACLVVGYFSGREHLKYELPSPSRAFLGGEKGADSSASTTQRSQETPSPEVLAYAHNLEIYGIRSSRSSGILHRGTPVVRGKIRNRGERTVRKVSLKYYFANHEQITIFETTDTEYFGGETLSGQRESPLRPGYVSKTFLHCETCPSECLAKPKKIEIVDIEFAN